MDLGLEVVSSHRQLIGASKILNEGSTNPSISRDKTKILTSNDQNLLNLMTKYLILLILANASSFLMIMQIFIDVVELN